jgi:hypothetical protein
VPDPKLTCAVYDGDRITVRRTTDLDGSDYPIILEAIGDGYVARDVFTSVDSARTFARSILAMADEVDGGEVTPAAPEPVKVGDRVRVTKAEHSHWGAFVGRMGVLMELDSQDQLPYLVKFGDGRHGDEDGQWWCHEVERVDELCPVVDPPRLRPPTRLELLETALRLVPHADVSDALKIAIYLEGN